jgi:hypothetical protein
VSGKQPQSQAELQGHLQDHIEFLQSSANAFDNGFEGEAKRLAASLRVLLHDSKNSVALLTQLGKKGSKFWDTAISQTPGNLSSHNGLAVMVLNPSKGASYQAFLDEHPGDEPRLRSFEEWWKCVVFVDGKQNSLTREQIVLCVAEQNGGVHVDPALSPIYAALSRQNSLGWMSHDGKGSRPLEGPERSALRQITHEVLKYLIPGYAKKPLYPPDSLIAGAAVLLSGDDATSMVRKLESSPVKKTNFRRNESCHCGSGKRFKHCHGKP